MDLPTHLAYFDNTTEPPLYKHVYFLIPVTTINNLIIQVQVNNHEGHQENEQTAIKHLQKYSHIAKTSKIITHIYTQTYIPERVGGVGKIEDQDLNWG